MREEGCRLGQSTGVNGGDEIVECFRKEHYRGSVEVLGPGAALVQWGGLCGRGARGGGLG